MVPAREAEVAQVRQMKTAQLRSTENRVLQVRALVCEWVCERERESAEEEREGRRDG